MSFYKRRFAGRRRKSQALSEASFDSELSPNYGAQLRDAVKIGDLEKVKLVLKGCYKCIDEKDSDDWTALMLAASRRDREIMVKELINAGANLDESSSKGETALIVAVSSGQVEIVKELVNAGAKLNEKDCNGKTALAISACTGKTEILEILLAAGADITIADKDDMALKNAIKRNEKDCAKLLKDAKSGVFPTCDEVGLLPPEKRISKLEIERRWTSRTTAEVRKSKWVIE